MRPHRQRPTRLPSRDSPGKHTGVGCHFLLQCMKVKSESEVAQSCPTLRDPMDCSPPGSSVHGISQARVLEWVAIAFSVLRIDPLILRNRKLTGWFVLGCDSDLKVHSSDENVLCVDPVLSPVSELGTQEGWTLSSTSGCAGLGGARGRPPGNEESWFQALSGRVGGGRRGQLQRTCRLF